MLFSSEGIRKEIEKHGEIVKAKLNEIEKVIPYQSELEKENNKLVDSNVRLKEQVETLNNEIISIQEINKKLMNYIENIEEIKEAGGIVTKMEDRRIFDDSYHEIKIIPEIMVVKRIKEFEVKKVD